MASLSQNPAEAFTAEKLSQILHRFGHLHQGAIETIATLEIFESPTAYVWFQRLSYSSDTTGDVPEHIAIKRYKSRVIHELIDREVYFYARLAPSVGPLPIVQCFAAHHDPTTGMAYCVLEDCSPTHQPGELVAHAALPQLYATLHALAQLHARFWGHASVTQVLLPDTRASFIDDFTFHQQRLDQLCALFGDRLPSEWEQILRRFIQSGEGLLLDRLAKQDTLTLVHSDPHLGNVLFPRASDADHALLIDFAFSRAWWGCRDVAFTLTFATDPEVRREFETQLLRYYYDQLLENGVQGYGWDQCWHDYRLGVITNLRTPLGNRKQPYVWYRFERAIRAYQDLGCAELLA